MTNKLFSILPLFIAAFFIVQPLNAQTKIGAGLAFGTEISNIGITAKAQHGFTEVWEGAGSFTYYLTGEDAPGVDLNLWTLNFDAHYILSSTDNFNFYPLAGLNIAGVTVDFDTGFPGFDGSNTSTEVGLNIGAGGELKFSESLSGVAELKYVLGDFDQLVINAGVLFAIGNK